MPWRLWWYVPSTFQCTWTLIICYQRLRDCHEYARHVSYSDTCRQHCLHTLLAKLNWQISGAGSVISRLNTYLDISLVRQSFNHMAAKAVDFSWICKLVSYILTLLVNIVMTEYIAKLDCQFAVHDLSKQDPWHMCRIHRCAWKWLNCTLLTLLSSQCVHGHRFPVHLKFTTDKWFNALHCIFRKIWPWLCILT
jgi:hypothetical protein